MLTFGCSCREGGCGSLAINLGIALVQSRMENLVTSLTNFCARVSFGARAAG